MPVFGGSDLRRVGLIAADEPAEQLSGFSGGTDRQQEMPHHRHSVPAQDKSLNICEIQRGLAVSGRRRFASKQPAEKSAALFCGRRGSIVGSAHGIVLIPYSLTTGIDAC
jgi:hypothetical protein